MTLQDDLLKNANKLVFGTDRVLKLLRNDKIQRVYLAKNCKEDTRESVKNLAKNTEVIELDTINSEIGTICKKPFSISVVGLSK